MTLAKYMSANGLNDAKMAKIVGISRSYVGHLRTGIRTPTVPIALRIERVTKGKVRVQAWGEAV